MDPPSDALYRLRYRALGRGSPCGPGCLYHCCDPVITCFSIAAHAPLADRLLKALPERRRQIERFAPFLIFEALSLPDLPALPGIDTARPPQGFVQVNLLWRCPHLRDGLCSVYDQPRPSICTGFRHCPEHAAGGFSEERFLELARGYWGLRRRVLECAAGAVGEALARREMKELIFLL
jgi:hypothetical protein